MGMKMLDGFPLTFTITRNGGDQLAMFDTFSSEQCIGNRPYLAAGAPQNDHFETIVRVEMHVNG